MSTLLSTIISRARVTLLEPTASFWSDAELLDHARAGIGELWRAINDNYQDYFLTVDSTNVAVASGTATLTGVPSDVSIVRKLRPRSLSSYPGVIFLPRKRTDPEFENAEGETAVDPSNGGTFFYAITGAGAPTGAPTITIAPTMNTAFNLTLIYIPVLSLESFLASTANPIPGESDKALEHWIVAHARAKERPERDPDPEHIAHFSTLKTNILTSLTPRQTQEPPVAEALFESYS